MTNRPADARSEPGLPERAEQSLLRQVGGLLRETREDRGMDVRDVAEVLRIKVAYLEGLEDGDLSRISGRTYALGFLRSYADYLGFDGDAIVEEVRRTNAQLPENPRLQYRKPLAESQKPPLIAVGLSLLLAAGVYVGWTHWQERQAASRADGAAAVASLEQVATDAGAAGARTADVAAASDAAPTPDPVAAAEAATDVAPGVTVVPFTLPDLPPVPVAPATGDDFVVDETDDGLPAEPTAPPDEELVSAILASAVTADGTGESPGATDDPAAVDAAAAAGGTTAAGSAQDLLQIIAEETGTAEVRPLGDQEAGGRVVLVASEASWVQVRSADRNYVWTRTMEPGDAYFAPNRDDLALWTGNAGGLRVILDGRPLTDIGRRGQVQRDIPLAPEQLRARYATN
ncbi:MAG: RodZ domain-containing protein [Pseudomonadota bacterium]